MNTLTDDAILRHAIRAYQTGEEYAKCQETKEKLMTGEKVNRFEISRLQPQIKGNQPVYRFDGENWLVASAKYDMVIYPQRQGVGLSVGLLGVLRNTTSKVLWLFPHQIDDHTVDGPNGMFWYRGTLYNPRIPEDMPSRAIGLARAHYRVSKPIADVHRDGKASGLRVLADTIGDEVASGDLHWSTWLGTAGIGTGLLALGYFVYTCTSTRRHRPRPIPLSSFV